MVLRNLVRNWVIFADPGEADDDSSNRALNIQTGKRIESKLKKTRVIRSLDYDRIFFPTCSNFLPFLPSPRSMEKFPWMAINRGYSRNNRNNTYGVSLHGYSVIDLSESVLHLHG